MKGSMKEMVGGCCVCSDERGWPENPLVYCDGQGCTVAVHQACYGIVTVPTGPWYCRKCESQERAARVRCELCPSKDGALKRTDSSGWAHVVCALYIPEVRFGNVTTMEPIILQLIPPERYNKVCYICEELGKGGRSTIGACMQCNKSGCKQQFHVTCAQALGLLCEEAGNYLDNVKYCGYCQHHYSKLKKGGNVKTIPPYKPIPTDNHSSDSSPEKEAEGANINNKIVPQSSSSSAGKRKSNSSNNKSSSSSSKSSSSTNKSNSSSSSSHQKTVHSSSTSSSTKQTSTIDKSSNKNFSSSSSVKSVVKNVENDTTVINSHQTDADVKTIDKSSPALQNVSSKDSVKFPSANLNESVSAPTGDIVFGDNSNSNLSTASSVKDNIKPSKKRKANSRTPTPNSITDTERSASANTVINVTQSVSQNLTSVSTSVSNSDRRDSVTTADAIEKPKKAKTETSTHPTVSHITSSSVRTSSSPSVIAEQPSTQPNNSVPNQIVTTSTSAHGAQASLVVSVPLVNTSLSPITGQNISTTNSTGLYQHLPERVERSPVNNNNNTGQSGALHSISSSTSLDSTMVSSEGGLKITYEKQPQANSSSLSRLSSETPPVMEQIPAKRSRSQSADKSDKMGRNKKRGSNGVPTVSGPASGAGKRTSRSQHATPPPPQIGAFSSVTHTNQQQQQPTLPPPPPQLLPQQTSTPTTTTATTTLTTPATVKESPPSSPSDESTGMSSGRRTKGRKSAPATITSATTSTSGPSTSGICIVKDTKDIKVFQNGVHAPHMLGNQLNPNSNMAQKMTDHLNSELEAHSIYNPVENNSNLVGPQLHSKVIASVRSTNSSSAGSSSSSGGLSSMLGGGNSGTIPQTLDQLLERQWEQGSQFLMEQAQHFDIASLLSCLHQLRAENLRLEEHVNSLLQRRDHLLAVNARLAIPLTNQQPVAAPAQQHTINNLHPQVNIGHGDVPRSRHSGGTYPGHPGTPIENGLPPDGASYPHQHRSPGSSQPPQPSPTIRHSPASGASYPSTSGHNIVRSSSSSSSDSHPRSSSQRQQSYPSYQGQPVSVVQQQSQSQQSQMVTRRDTDIHHQSPSTKPS